ncbi:class I SAM-dependent methyltransferase [Arcicella rigui]|uniref:Class I SAM-dependent methyltransferase n=1 Tax=Arcicella rigui TaxID=797020 RepID=A0ABU5QGY5_9BACT|nr:class I SAM-dependent methyltransferase [Arcicella rigui]MEA5141802.1 class I SAM-dependent methyltransferase [Arcicella rigui]
MIPKSTFIDNNIYTNLEIGAGCGDFGKRFYPKCYLTDYDIELMDKCKTCFIDWFCDAHNLPWSNNRFDLIILCNPYNYGFKDDESTYKLLSELLRVLKKPGGEILLLSTKNNKFCNPQRVKKRIDQFCKINNNYNLEVKSEEIDCSLVYNGYIFREIIGDQIFPTSKININVK